MRKILIILFFGIVCYFNALAQPIKLSYTIKQLQNPNDKSIMVIAHRGDWRNAPENSIKAIENAITMGVDIVEIDVQKTKDGQLIIMHDETVDRTTNAKGFIKDYTLDSLKMLFLKNGLGRVTKHKIPTLEEALIAVKGKVLVNLDKAYDHLREAYPILMKTGTTKQAIFKSYFLTASKVAAQYGKLLDSILFMPLINIDNSSSSMDQIHDFQTTIKPIAFELNFKEAKSMLPENAETIKKAGSKVWINSLWASQNGGHDDDLAVDDQQPEHAWGWIIKQGANMIQTDRPKDLLTYLRSKHLHK
jgi:glycerophosphoryl diester phosphodiesterase